MRPKFLILPSLFLLLSFLTRPAQAYLGGFENADGYAYAYTYSQLDNWVDVTDYNAGQFGANAGGGAPSQQPVNSALWTYSSNPGSFFASPADRLTYMGGATPGSPPYYSSAIATPQTIAAYIIGGHFGGRLGTNALALRNATNSGLGPIQYDYKLDAYDFAGITPSTVTSGTVPVSFYFQPNPADGLISAAPGSGVFIPTKFIMSFKDSSGNVGLQWGYDRENNIQYRAGSSGPWTPTGLVGDPSNYDGVTVALNLSSQTFQINYYDISTNLTTTIAPAGTPLGAPMTDLTHLGWSLTDNLTSGVGGKNFFDDFSFALPTPEPTTALLLALATPLLLRKRRPY